MSKRIVSLLLIFAMLMTGFSVTATAAAEEEQTVNGVRYTVVKTDAELAQALKASKNVMLANDIELSTANFPQGKAFELNPSIIIDGNGYTLTYPKMRSTSLFNFKAGTGALDATFEIRNISFGTKDAPIVIAGADGLFQYTTDLGSELIFENVNFYVEKKAVNANSGAIFAKLGTVAHFRGCTLDVEMTNVIGGSLHGGWFGEIMTDGRVEMDNCTTTGNIKGLVGAAGFVAQNTVGSIAFYHCKNFANVTARDFVAGFVGNMGTGCVNTYAADCINYGSITSTGTTYESCAGGIFGRVSNRGTVYKWRLHVLYRCANYGTITAATVAGGIMGRNHDYDYNGRTFITVGECENLGVVKGGSYAGGIVGVVAPTVYAAELTDCVNIGAVISANGYAGNFAGLLSVGASIDGADVLDTVVEGGYAAGFVSAVSGKSGAIVGQNSGTYKISVGPYTDTTLNITAPNCSNVTYFGTLATVPNGVTKTENLNTLLADLGERLGTEVIAADASDRMAQVVLATPSLRGIQLDNSGENVLSIRPVAGLYAMDAYKSAGFEVTVTKADGTSATKTYYASALFTKINEMVGGQKKTVKADEIAAKYLYTAEITDIPASGRVTVKVTPFAVGRDGTKYTGNTKMLAVRDGKVTNETMSLNGVLLENFAIVYKATNKMAEQTLAKHLAKRIAELTGVDVPVMMERIAHNRAYTINIGTISTLGTVPAGRNISTVSDGVSIAITGDNTAQLGEAVQHFINLLEEKVNSSDHAFYITEPIQAPAKTTYSIMSFNMGAADDSNIKAAEWDLLVEYLPDIFTAQEPWAGFLDDFCNNFAVRPSTKFKASSADDDVMESDVNNKAFTGKDYYGIYWGMPRWEPGGPNENQGKASYSVVFYAKDRFTVNEAKSGTFMFSETPDVIGSKLSKSSMPRCATYVTLTDVNTGKEFVVVNVHLDHVNGQVEQATILVEELIKRVGKDTPMLITGDMNSKLDSAAIQHMLTNPTMPLYSFDYLSTETYWSDHTSFGLIDWIFTNTPEKVDVSYYRFCNDFNMFYGRWTGNKLQMYMPSDHPAIYCEFSFR
ncbi:MAG: hypothetical protein IJW49_07585 [Clostridia bacterium]|nr:hypothetical protein [Clostridia bacterium]